MIKNITYNEILKLWLNNKTDIKIQSKLTYERIINKYLINSVGNININKLKYENIENLFSNLKDISISTKKILLYIVKSSIKYAYSNKYCNYINLSNIKFKMPNKTIFVLSKEEQNRLENVLKNKINIRKLSILLCLYTGVRLGEVCGLKWKDIDFSNKSLNVNKTIERIKNDDGNSKTKLIISTPKSETSNRIVPIPDFLVELLKQFKKNDNYYILSNSNKLYDPRLLESFYKRILTKVGIKQNKFHTLRHSFSTRCIESKMDIKTLSEILGHSQVETTLKLYVHPSYDLKKSSIEHLVEFMTN